MAMLRDQETATTTALRRSHRETDRLIAALVDDGAAPAELSVVAHAPQPLDLPPAEVPWRWAAFAGAVVGVAAAVLLPGVVAALAATAATVAVLVVVARRSQPQRVLVAASYEIVATGGAASILAAREGAVVTPNASSTQATAPFVATSV